MNSLPQNTILNRMQLSMAYYNIKYIPDNEEIKYIQDRNKHYKIHHFVPIPAECALNEKFTMC
jgi:hypothetical protein